MVGNLPKHLLNASGSKIDHQYVPKLKMWLDDPLRGPLVLWGPPGTGKTYIAAALFTYIKSLPYKGGIFVSVPDLNQEFIRCCSDYKERADLLLKIKETDCLVLDDIGSKSPSEGFFDFMYSIINHRTDLQNSYTIYTTNLDNEDIIYQYGGAIESRMSSGIQIMINGEDRRKIKR